MSISAPKLAQGQRHAQSFLAASSDAVGRAGAAVFYPTFDHHFSDGNIPRRLELQFRQLAALPELLQSGPLDMSREMARASRHNFRRLFEAAARPVDPEAFAYLIEAGGLVAVGALPRAPRVSRPNTSMIPRGRGNAQLKNPQISGSVSLGLRTRTRAIDRIPWQELPVRLAAKGRRSNDGDALACVPTWPLWPGGPRHVQRGNP
jgi:hypothetical protein